MPTTAGIDGAVVQAAMRQSEPVAVAPDKSAASQSDQEAAKDSASAQPNMPATGTAILDVEQGGIEVPSFVGKTVRGAVEAAQDAGLELEAVGSGVARQQSPAAGMHVAAGAHVTVQFGR
jgi:cell division protein FtsI (penicillin-binding protein 3)